MKIGIALKRDFLLEDGPNYICEIISKRIYNGGLTENWNIATKLISINEYIDKCRKETFNNFICFDKVIVDDGNIVFNLNTKIIPIDFIFHSFIKKCDKYKDDDLFIAIDII